MPDANSLRLPGCGLHPRHYTALRSEILRTGVELSDAQLLDLADALDHQLRRRRPGASSSSSVPGATPESRASA